MSGHESYRGEILPNVLSEANILEVLELDKAGRWFEHSFINTSTIAGKPETVAQAIQSSMRPLADYAQRFGAYFVATVETSAEGVTTYTFMPAYHNKKIADQATAFYERRLQNSWAHIVIDGGQENYTDTEELGVMDDFLRDGTYSFDVSTDDGIRYDKIEVVRGNGVAREKAWVEWSGYLVTTSGNELFGHADARLRTSPPDIFSKV